jgi:hypothetical protein
MISLPRAKQGDFHIDKLVKYEHIFVVDPDGDAYYHFPHIYVDFSDGFSGSFEYLTVVKGHNEKINITDEWVRIDFFSQALASGPKPIVLCKDKAITLDNNTLKGHLEYKCDAETLYAIDDRFEKLNVRDIITISGTSDAMARYLKVTHIQKTTLGEYLRYHPNPFVARRFATQQVGREVSDGEALTIVEVSSAHPHEWE